jgi:hypothetical protein
VPVDLATVGDGYDVEFVPEKLGYYKIDIRVNGKSLSICPIVCQATLEESESSIRQSSSEQAEELDLSQVQVIGLQNSVVDVPQKFKGILEI